MSIPIAIPVSAQVYQTKTVFSATFNTPTINRYDFNSLANRNVDILTLKSRAIYIIERTNFSMNISEENFQDSIVTAPAISIKREVPNQQIYETPFEFVNYVDNLEMYAFFGSGQNEDKLQGTMTGVLQQTPTFTKMVVNAFLQFNIYKINSQEWIAKFDEAKASLGDGLALRGGFIPVHQSNDPRAY